MTRADAATATAQSIRVAAATLFVERGYAKTSVRDIAAAAGADPALVIRHFGSKEQLFLASVDPAREFGPVLDVPVDRLGWQLADFVISADERVRGVYLALVRASDSDEVGIKLQDAHEHHFIAQLLPHLSGPDASLRAHMIASVVGGLMYALWIVGDQDLLAADADELRERYGRLLQSLIDIREMDDA